MPTPHHSVFTGRMPFLPNQQRQSTGGTRVQRLIVGVYLVCRVGRCEQIVKLFANYQRISEVLRDKPSSSAGGGGIKKRGRQAKDVAAAAGTAASSTGKAPGGMLSIHFLSAALTALYRQAVLPLPLRHALADALLMYTVHTHTRLTALCPGLPG